MSGKFELKQLTLKPNEVNKLIKKELEIPFQIKAGLISKISVEYGSILQLSNVKVQVDELMIVVKPSYNQIKSGADYFESEALMNQLTTNYNLNESTVNSSDKNIFKTFRLKKLINQIQEGLKRIRSNSSKMGANQTIIDENKSNSKSEEKGIFEKAIEEKLKEMLEKLKITFNRIHIRLEDDDISFQNPLSIGILIENLLLLPQKREVLSMIHPKLVNVSTDSIQSNREQIKWLKFLQVTNLTIYLKNKSEQAIPDSLLREVTYQNLGILEAISFEDLRNFLISQFFNADSSDLHIFKILQISLIKCNYLHTTSPKANDNIQSNMYLNSKNMLSSQSQLQFINSQLTNMQNNFFIQMSITEPQIMINKEYFNTVKDVTQFLYNQTYWSYLDKFKPKLRPYVKEFNLNMTTAQKRVNQLIIRDWFKVLIWKHRIQNVKKETYPDVYKQFQLTSILYSLEYPQFIFGALLTFFNENLTKELNDEIEMLQNMKESEKRSMQLIEELKDSTFTFVFKINKFELFFIDKTSRFFTCTYNLLYFEASNKFNEQLLFFDLSPVSVYLHGEDGQIQINKERQKQQTTQQETMLTEVTPFQPRCIYDKRYLKDKNNDSFVSNPGDIGQKKASQRKIFDNQTNYNSNPGSRQHVFASIEGYPPFSVNNSFVNGQFPFSQQATMRSHNDQVVYQTDGHSEKQTKYSQYNDNESRFENQPTTAQQINYDMQQSSPSSKKRKQIFEQDFFQQDEFFQEKQPKEKQEKNKVDLNKIMKSAKDRRDLVETKSNCVIKFQTISSKNEVSLNAQLPEIKINSDTRDLKEIFTYFQEFPIQEFFDLILKCFITESSHKLSCIVRKSTSLRKKQNKNAQSTLQFSQSCRIPAGNSKLSSKLIESLPKISVQDYNLEKNFKDGLFQFDDDEDDDMNEGVNTKEPNFFSKANNPDPDLIDSEELKIEPAFPKEFQSLFMDGRNINSKLESIIEDPNELIQTTYKSNTRLMNLQQTDEINMSKGQNTYGRESKLSYKISNFRSQIQLYQIFNYYLYQKITSAKRKKEKQKEKKIDFIDILEEYIAQRQYNICISIGLVNIDMKDHFSQDESENIIKAQIPSGQIIINFNSQLTNRHLIDIYHFKMTTTSKFKIIKYMINRIKKMIDLSDLFKKEEEDFDLDF